MNEIVFELRIEEEAEAQPAVQSDRFTTDDPAFGIWRDHEDTNDVAAYVQRLRAPRFNRDGSRHTAS